jgi:hypothetical protein
MGENRNAYRIFQKERDHLENQNVCGWAILKWILREMGWDGRDWIDLTQNRGR